MLYDWYDTGGFTNTSPYIDPPIRLKDFELWLVSLKDFIPLFYCPVFVCLILLEPFDIVLLSQQRFLDSNPAL